MALKLKVQGAERHNNVVVKGPPMSGKTWYVASQVDMDKTLFISTDGNAVKGSKVAEVNSWNDLMEAIEYALSRDDMNTIVLDLLDDAVAYAENRAQKKLGMSGKADAKGAYNKFTNTVGELVQEEVLRPLLMSNKEFYVIMHTNEDKNGFDAPTFGSFSSDALVILNWISGRCNRIVRCDNPSEGAYEVIIESERKPEGPPNLKLSETPKEAPKEKKSRKKAA
jgi:hypothetical protein